MSDKLTRQVPRLRLEYELILITLQYRHRQRRQVQAQEVPLRCHQHHQLADEPREPSHTPLQRQQLQAAQTAHAKTGTGAWAGWNERYWQEHGVEDIGREAEAKLGAV